MANILDTVVEISNRRAIFLAELARIDAELVRACGKVSQSVPNNSAPEAADQTSVRGQAKPVAATTTATTPAATDAPKRRGRKSKGTVSEPAIVDSGATSSEPDAESTASDPGGLGLGSGPADAVGSSEFDEPEDDAEGPDGVPVEVKQSSWLSDYRFAKLHASVDRNQAAQLLDAVHSEFSDGWIHEDNWISVGRISVDGIAALNEMRGTTAVLVLLDALKKVGVVTKQRVESGTQWQIIPF